MANIHFHASAAEITPCPTVVIRKERFSNPDRTERGWKIAWDVSGTIRATSQSALKTAVDALEAAFVSGVAYAIKGADNSAALAELPQTSAMEGTRVTNRNFPKGEGVEWWRKREWSVNIEASYLDAGASNVYDDQVTTAYATDKIQGISGGNDRTTITVSGSLKTPTGVSALSKKPAASPPSGYYTKDSNYSTNVTDTSLSYSYVYAQRIDGSSSGAGVWEGSYTKTSSQDAHNQFTTNVSGSFTGDSAAVQTWIAGIISGITSSTMILQTYSLSQVEYTKTWQFSATWLDTANSHNLVEYTETIAYADVMAENVFHRPVGGIPVKEGPTGYTTATCTQSGHARAISGFPAPALPRYSTTYYSARPEISRTGPDEVGSVYKYYETTWHYSFEFTANPMKLAPHYAGNP
jgi:hypothetical protein